MGSIKIISWTLRCHWSDFCGSAVETHLFAERVVLELQAGKTAAIRLVSDWHRQVAAEVQQ